MGFMDNIMIPGEFVGSELPAKVDPADPQKVVVDWDAAAAAEHG